MILVAALLFSGTQFAISSGGRGDSYIDFDKDVVDQGETITATWYRPRMLGCDYLEGMKLNGEWLYTSKYDKGTSGSHCAVYFMTQGYPATPTKVNKLPHIYRYAKQALGYGFPDGTPALFSVTQKIATSDLVPGTHRVEGHNFDAYTDAKLAKVNEDNIIEKWDYERKAQMLDGKFGYNPEAYAEFKVEPVCREIKEGEMYLLRAFYAGQQVSKKDMKYPINAFDDCWETKVIDASPPRKVESNYDVYYKLDAGETLTVPIGEVWVMFPVIDSVGEISCTAEQYYDADVNSCYHMTGLLTLCEGGRLLDNGTCLILTEKDCLSQGSEWNEELERCAYDPCEKAGKGEVILSYDSCGHRVDYCADFDYEGRDMKVFGTEGTINTEAKCVAFLGTNVDESTISCAGIVGTIYKEATTDTDYYCIEDMTYDCSVEYPETKFTLKDKDYPACSYGKLEDCNKVSIWNKNIGLCADIATSDITEVRIEGNVVEKIIHDFTTEEVIPWWMWLIVGVLGVGIVYLLVFRKK